MKRLVSLAIFFLSFNALAVDLKPFEYKYELSYGELTLGQGTLKLEKESNNLWRFSFRAKSEGLVSLLYDADLHEESWVEADIDGNLRSKRYRFRVAGDEELDHTVFFNYLTFEIHRKDGKEKWNFEEEVAADRLSFPFIIAHELANGQDLRETYLIAGYHHFWNVSFLNLGKEEVSRGNVVYQTVRLQAKDGEEEIDIWLDHENNFTPVEVNFYSGKGWASKYYLVSQ